MRCTSSRGLAAIAVLALCAGIPAGHARADEPSSSGADDDQKARELFRLAESHYAAGRYEKAVVLYDEAYQLSGRAELLLAMANTYERMGDYQQAIVRLRDYLKHPRARNAASLRDRLRRLEAAERDREEENERLRRLEKADQERAQELRRLREEGSRSTAAVAVTAEPTGPSNLRAYLLLGGGAVGIGGAVVFGIVSRRAGQDAEDLCSDDGLCRGSAQRSLDREKRYGLFADLSAVVGIGSAAVGVYFLVKNRGADREERSALRIEPTVIPGGLGVGLAGDI